MTSVRLRLEGPGLSHPYLLEPGLLGRVGAMLREEGASRCVVLTDRQVAERWRGTLEAGLAGLRADFLVLEPGEERKSLDTARTLYADLVGLAADRRTPLLAFGGGVVGDLGGFVAATFLRGLPLYHLPTTLLAMIDSSVGGKTGVDLPEGKNLVGAFYAPRAVWADPDVLATLPMREWAGGMAEAIKHAIIGSPELFERLEELVPAPDLWSAEERCGLVEAAVRVKLDVVSRDPFEAGERAHLNLGHTLGHALEAAGGYRALSHGESVALGTLAAVRLARRRGELEEDLEPWLVALLRAWDLPRAIPPGLAWPDVEAALGRDKKRIDGSLAFVLPQRIGAVVVVRDVSVGEVRAVFEELLQGGRGPGFG